MNDKITISTAQLLALFPDEQAARLIAQSKAASYTAADCNMVGIGPAALNRRVQS